MFGSETLKLRSEVESLKSEVTCLRRRLVAQEDTLAALMDHLQLELQEHTTPYYVAHIPQPTQE